jgi:hypothetical protein
MKITKVTVGFGSTVNLGNFNSARFDVQLEAELEPGEDADTIINDLHLAARGHVQAQALPIVRKNQLRLEEVIRHLPDELQEQVYAHAGKER